MTQRKPPARGQRAERRRNESSHQSVAHCLPGNPSTLMVDSRVCRRADVSKRVEGPAHAQEALPRPLMCTF